MASKRARRSSAKTSKYKEINSDDENDKLAELLGSESGSDFEDSIDMKEMKTAKLIPIKKRQVEPEPKKKTVAEMSEISSLPEEQTSAQNLLCPVCSIESVNIRRLKTHLLLKHPDVNLCLFCIE